MSNVIKQAFTSTVRKAGFKKKGAGWFHETDDAVLVVNLQRSSFGEQYFVNLAVWLKALGGMKFPKEYDCHIRIRATALDAERQRYWETEVFNLERAEMPDRTRLELIQSFVEKIAVPFLLACGSLSELRRLYREGRLTGAAVITTAQRLLENR